MNSDPIPSHGQCPFFVTSDVSRAQSFPATWEGSQAADYRVTEWQLQGVTAMRVSDRFAQGSPYYASPGPFYLLGEWERNGYDDSDFNVVFWDDATQSVHSVEFASTRYGGGWNYSKDLQRAIPQDVIARIRADVYRRTLASLVCQETQRCETPDPDQMPFATRVRLTANSRKGCKTPYEKDETGEVTGQYWFGTYYARGYNQRTRSNGRLGLRMSDGRTVFCAMTIARLDELPDIAKCERLARQLSDSSSPIRCPGAWWTSVNDAPFAVEMAKAS